MPSMFWSTSILLLAAAAAASAQMGATVSATAYETPEEAAKHLPPLPAQCTNSLGENLCEPSFVTQKVPGSANLSWTPGPWKRWDSGDYCIDRSGKLVVPCGVAGAYRPTVPVPTVALAGQPPLEPRIRFADRAYDTPQEAMKHLLSVPPGCKDPDVGNVCVPTFITEVAHPPDGIAWRPAEWVRADHKGVCSDSSGKVWHACGSPGAGPFRLLVPRPLPPPPLFIKPVATSAP